MEHCTTSVLAITVHHQHKQFGNDQLDMMSPKLMWYLRCQKCFLKYGSHLWWSMVLNAADRSSMRTIDTILWSRDAKISLFTLNNAVSVEYFRYADWSGLWKQFGTRWSSMRVSTTGSSIFATNGSLDTGTYSSSISLGSDKISSAMFLSEHVWSTLAHCPSPWTD